MVPLGRAAVVVQLAELSQSITRGHGFESNRRISRVFRGHKHLGTTPIPQGERRKKIIARGDQLKLKNFYVGFFSMKQLLYHGKKSKTCLLKFYSLFLLIFVIYIS